MSRLALPLLVSALLLTGCGSEPESAPSGRKASPHTVEIHQVTKAPVAALYERSGSLAAQRVVRVFSQEEGMVRDVPFHEGDSVKKGALLLSLDDSLLQAELGRERAHRQQAEQNLARIEKLVADKLVSEDEITRARTELQVARASEKVLRTRLGFTRMHAAFDGVISERLVEPGDVVSKHGHVLTLTDPTSLVVETELSEKVIADLGKGTPSVEVRIDALGNDYLPAHIVRIHPSLKPATRSATVEVALDALPDDARVGQLARLRIQPAAEARLMIPFSAVQRDRDIEFVYRVNAEGKAERAVIQTGLRIGNDIAVDAGINAGDQVVVRGLLGLRPGKQLKITDAGAR